MKSVKLDEKLHRELKAEAARRGLFLQHALTAAVEAWIGTVDGLLGMEAECGTMTVKVIPTKYGRKTKPGHRLPVVKDLPLDGPNLLHGEGRH